MEMASWLAGLRWSDHPACTHPVLAALARQVNDRVGDEQRQRLAPMVPDVIGTACNDPVVPARIARACALAVLRADCPEQHGVAALSLLRSETSLNQIAGRCTYKLSREANQALNSRTEASHWAHGFSRRLRFRPRRSKGADRRAAKAAIGIAGSALQFAPDGGDRLVALLAESIEICRSHASLPSGRTTGNPGVRRA